MSEAAFFLGCGGVTFAAVLAAAGAAYGSTRGGTALATAKTYGGELGGLGMLPLVMCGMLPLYSIVFAAIASQKLSSAFRLFDGIVALFMGLVCGGGCLIAGLGLGSFSAAALSRYENAMLFPFVLICVFFEILALLGLVSSLFGLK